MGNFSAWLSAENGSPDADAQKHEGKQNVRILREAEERPETVAHKEKRQRQQIDSHHSPKNIAGIRLDNDLLARAGLGSVFARVLMVFSYMQASHLEQSPPQSAARSTTTSAVPSSWTAVTMAFCSMTKPP